MINQNPYTIPQCQQCYKCKQSDFTQQLTQLKCQHYYHNKCLSELLANQIEIKKQIIVKCLCGTKVSTNQIRISNQPDRLFLLNKLFRMQLTYICESQFRKLLSPGAKEKIHESEIYGDYYLIAKTESLEYTNTPQ